MFQMIYHSILPVKYRPQGLPDNFIISLIRQQNVTLRGYLSLLRSTAIIRDERQLTAARRKENMWGNRKGEGRGLASPWAGLAGADWRTAWRAGGSERAGCGGVRRAATACLRARAGGSATGVSGADLCAISVT